MSNISRKFTHKGAFSIFTLGLLELAKIYQLDSQQVQRNLNTGRIASMMEIKQVVESTLLRRNAVIMRPFTIDIQSIQYYWVT
jgi:hypothetical protein